MGSWWVRGAASPLRAGQPVTNIAARGVCAIPPTRGARYELSGIIRNRSPRCAAKSPTTCYPNSTLAFFVARLSCNIVVPGYVK